MVGLWKRLQKEEWARFWKGGGKGVFSIQGHKVATVLSPILAKHLWPGLTLDVGCGCLAHPSYMPEVSGHRFIGIDPFFGTPGARVFPFAQSVGEALPFQSGSFDNVFFASSIDHLINPVLGIQEAHRVLKPGRTLIVWYSRRGGSNYEKWLRRSGARLFNKCHQWAWNDKSMARMVVKQGFTIRQVDKFGPKNRLLFAEKA